MKVLCKYIFILLLIGISSQIWASDWDLFRNPIEGAFNYGQSNTECMWLYLDIRNHTHSSVAATYVSHDIDTGALSTKGADTIHGFEQTRWIFKQKPWSLKGPEGEVVYSWKKPGDPSFEHICKIHFDQTYCGLFHAGKNKTTVEGSCTVYNDQPALGAALRGIATITLINTD